MRQGLYRIFVSMMQSIFVGSKFFTSLVPKVQYSYIWGCIFSIFSIEINSRFFSIFFIFFNFLLKNVEICAQDHRNVKYNRFQSILSRFGKIDFFKILVIMLMPLKSLRNLLFLMFQIFRKNRYFLTKTYKFVLRITKMRSIIVFKSFCCDLENSIFCDFWPRVGTL